MQLNWKKNTAVFMTSQAISIFGSSLVQYAITWYITLMTQSGIYATLSIICGFLPTFFLAPFAGVWADRYNRKYLIIIADACIALCTLLLAIVYLVGFKAIWLLFVASGIRALGSAVQSPCVGAMLPDIVPEDRLTRVNGINGTLQSAITLASPMLSGVLLGMSSIEVIFFIDVATAALAILVLLLFFRYEYQPKEKDGQACAYLGEFKQGLSYILKHRYLRDFFIFSALFFFVAAPVAFLTPLQVARNYGGEVWHLSAIEVAFSVGMIAGGILVSAWGGFKNRIHTMALAGVLMAGCTIVLGTPIVFWIYLAMMTLFGVALPIFHTPAMVLLQEQVESAYMGRVFGIMTMISSSVMPMGMLLFGPIADVIAIEWLLLITGGVLLLITFTLIADKPLVRAGMKTPQE
ncbi:MAG: MFS transporter [Christensenellales bacterium]|jgi:DHA3 family macrolide efflux protein-like MFS transporter